jgi:hypothetical protein
MVDRCADRYYSIMGVTVKFDQIFYYLGLRSRPTTYRADEALGPHGVRREAMRKLTISGIMIVLSIAVSIQAVRGQNRDCTRKYSHLTALNDLGTGYYLGEQGGLYPGGSNECPQDHLDAGIRIGESIVPLDANGNEDPENGVILLISVGMSNARWEFKRFMEDVEDNPAVNPKLVLLNGGGPFRNYCQRMAADIGEIAKNVKTNFENVRLLYCTSRVYGNYTIIEKRSEPISYETGFGFKWAIEAQIEGDPELNYDPRQGKVMAPWMSWGPYMWADGIFPRSDGLIWHCEDFEEDDGYHPEDGAKQKMSDALMDFFSTDPTAATWFLAD